MMDTKEALKELEDLTVDYGNRNEEQITRLDEAIDMAMEALRNLPNRLRQAMDTISRQAAIDALEKVAELFPWRVPGNRDSYDRYNEAWNDAIGRAEIEIEKLPSAQPEIVLCKDCKYWNDEFAKDKSTCWLPCMSMTTHRKWYCGSAERRTDDRIQGI